MLAGPKWLETSCALQQRVVYWRIVLPVPSQLCNKCYNAEHETNVPLGNHSQ